MKDTDQEDLFILNLLRQAQHLGTLEAVDRLLQGNDTQVFTEAQYLKVYLKVMNAESARFLFEKDPGLIAFHLGRVRKIKPLGDGRWALK